MVCQRDNTNFSPRRSPGQETVTQFPRGHFDGRSIRPRVSTDIGPTGDKRQAEPFGRAFHKTFVGIAGPAAKLVVEMGRRQPPTMCRRQPRQEVQQGHRIQPAGNRDHHGAAIAKKPLRANGPLNPLRQIAHAAMLCMPARRGNVLCPAKPGPLRSVPKLLISGRAALTLPHMANTSLSELIPVLQVAIGPVILISGVGLLLLTLTNRYGRAIDRSRQLVQEMGSLAGGERERLARQVEILYRRARLIQVSVIMAAICLLLVTVLISVLFFTALFKLEDGLLVTIIFIACMASLIVSLLAFIREVQLSLHALKLELEHVRKV
jgi:hypothetical protein